MFAGRLSLDIRATLALISIATDRQEGSMAATIGIIGGGGWLGGAIAGRALAAGALSASSLLVSGRTPRPERFAAWPGVTWIADNAELARRSEIVILSVRPEQFGDISIDVQGKLVISVMAGLSMDTLRKKVNSERIVRAMPNAAAEIGRSFTPWLASERVSTADRAFVKTLFSCCGDEEEIETEQQLDYLSGLSGTGPAYPALLAKAMLQHARDSGIPETVAKKAVRAVICGAPRLMDNDAFDPAGTVETFLAYRGVTAAGLETMVQKGFPGSVGTGLAAAADAAAGMARKYDG
jgi:pyrroline-5-carboxylate reductase